MRPGAANAAGARTDGAGRAIAFEGVEPWPEPVNGCVLLVELVAALRRYVVINSLQAVAVALWIVFTFVHDAFDVSPRLNVKSTHKCSGKTKLLSVLRRLGPSGVIDLRSATDGTGGRFHDGMKLATRFRMIDLSSIRQRFATLLPASSERDRRSWAAKRGSATSPIWGIARGIGGDRHCGQQQSVVGLKELASADTPHVGRVRGAAAGANRR